jgi:dephospho-CoA kinase
MLVIGLTGGIATGKSTVSKMFSEHGIPVIDTDLIARDLLKVGTKAYDEVLEEFPVSIILTNNEISRKKLAEVIFRDKEKRDELNNIIHPKVREIVLHDLEGYKSDDKKIVIVDVPLLFESKFDEVVDKVIVVYTTKENQLMRLIDRDIITEEYALSKIDSQMSLDEKIERADFLIDNSKSIIETKKDFLRIMKEIEVL